MRRQGDGPAVARGGPLFCMGGVGARRGAGGLPAEAFEVGAVLGRGGTDGLDFDVGESSAEGDACAAAFEGDDFEDDAAGVGDLSGPLVDDSDEGEGFDEGLGGREPGESERDDEVALAVGAGLGVFECGLPDAVDAVLVFGRQGGGESFGGGLVDGWRLDEDVHDFVFGEGEAFGDGEGAAAMAAGDLASAGLGGDFDDGATEVADAFHAGFPLGLARVGSPAVRRPLPVGTRSPRFRRRTSVSNVGRCASVSRGGGDGHGFPVGEAGWGGGGAGRRVG